jgi:hypothetical protein
MKWSDFLRRYVIRKTAKQPFLRHMPPSRAWNHGLSDIRLVGRRNRGRNPLQHIFAAIWAVPVSGRAVRPMIAQGQAVPSVKRFRRARNVRRPAAVQQTGWLMACSWSNATQTPKTVIRRVFRGLWARIRLFCLEFRPNSTYKPAYALSSLETAALSIGGGSGRTRSMSMLRGFAVSDFVSCFQLVRRFPDV